MEEERCNKILEKCQEEIEAVLEKYGVEMEAGSFYNGCWVQLTVQGTEPYIDKFKRKRFREYTRKI
jgi:hypothetical protein